MNKYLLKYIAALFLFGSNGIIASQIQMNSYEIVMFRTLIGSLFLIFIYFITNNRFTFYMHKISMLFLLLSGIAMGISWLFLYEAYQELGVGIASLGYYCGPVIVMAVSPIIFKEHFTAKKVIGFIMVFSGIILVNLNAVNESHTGFGIFCSLMSAIMYAFMVILNKKVEHIGGLENATLQLTCAFLTVLIYVTYKQGFHYIIVGTDIAPLIFLGLINTGLGCYLYFSSIGKINVQTVAILGYLEPLSAIVFAFLFLQESMSFLQIIGAFLIIGGAIGAEFFHSKQ